MTKKKKEKVRGILFSQPKNKELAEYSGRRGSHIAELKSNSRPGVASIYQLLEFKWKVDAICDATNDDKEIIDIIDLEPSDKELAEFAGISEMTVYQMRTRAKDNQRAYGYAFHLLRYKLEKIADLVI